jgi:hypothetical protein
MAWTKLLFILKDNLNGKLEVYLIKRKYPNILLIEENYIKVAEFILHCVADGF